jgi:hypothetical protein
MIGDEVAWVAPLLVLACVVLSFVVVLFDRFGNLKRYVGGLVHFDGSA